jgi:hypothetical protein
MKYAIQDVVIDLHTRQYPDVAATALRHLRRYKTRHWGVGPHHEELRRLGLVTFGTPDRQWRQGVFAGPGVLCATDGHRLHTVDIPGQDLGAPGSTARIAKSACIHCIQAIL